MSGDMDDPLRETRRLQRLIDRGEFLSTWQLSQESGESPDNLRRKARLGQLPHVQTPTGRLFATHLCLAVLGRKEVGSDVA